MTWPEQVKRSPPGSERKAGPPIYTSVEGESLAGRPQVLPPERGSRANTAIGRAGHRRETGWSHAPDAGSERNLSAPFEKEGRKTKSRRENYSAARRRSAEQGGQDIHRSAGVAPRTSRGAADGGRTITEYPLFNNKDREHRQASCARADPGTDFLAAVKKAKNFIK